MKPQTIGIASAFTSFLTLIALAPYELGAVATMFPPAWKQQIAVAGALATLILRVLGKTIPNKP